MNTKLSNRGINVLDSSRKYNIASVNKLIINYAVEVAKDSHRGTIELRMINSTRKCKGVLLPSEIFMSEGKQ